MNFNHLKHIRGLDLAAKILWRMFFEHNPLFVTMQDKYAVKAFAAARGVQTAKLLYVTDSPETIPFNQLPQNYIIKVNHGSNMNILCRDGKLYSFEHGGHLLDRQGQLYNTEIIREYELSQEACIEKCKFWLGQKFTFFEWAYHQIKPKIIIEENLVSTTNQELMDYRLYVFDGEVKALNTGSATNRQFLKASYFDVNWGEIILTQNSYAVSDHIPAKPNHYQDMLDAAKRLGKGISFLRIDFYETSQGAVLGEITIYPAGIQNMAPTTCRYFNSWLSNHWKLNRWDSLIAHTLNILYWSSIMPILKENPKIYKRVKKALSLLRT